MDKLRLLKRKYEQLIEDFEHQFTGSCMESFVASLPY